MDTTVDAIYEHGVLRLVEPISLPDGTLVQVTVTEKVADISRSSPAAILEAIAAMTEPAEQPETASRDHDAYLVSGS